VIAVRTAVATPAQPSPLDFPQTKKHDKPGSSCTKSVLIRFGKASQVTCANQNEISFTGFSLTA
jgi:hypothetical protein